MDRRHLLRSAAALIGAGAALTAEASVVLKTSEKTMPVDTMNRIPGWEKTTVKPLEIKGRRIGEGRPKIIAPTTAKNAEDLKKVVKTFAGMPELDMIEVRADYLGKMDGSVFAALTRELYTLAGDKIVLVTLRNGTDGGAYVADDKFYEDFNAKVIAEGRMDLIDLEMFRDADMTRRLVDQAHKKGIKVIVSEHEFAWTPSEGEIIRRLMLQDKIGADILKMAVMAHNTEDALTMMSATAKMRHYYTEKPMLTMSMGKYGVLTRLTGEAFGADLTFVSVGGKASAPGQIPSKDCLQVLETLHKGMNPTL